MSIAVGLLALTTVVLALLLRKERHRRLIHELAADEALEQHRHESNTGATDSQSRKEAVRQRVERRLHGHGQLSRARRRALEDLYK